MKVHLEHKKMKMKSLFAFLTFPHEIKAIGLTKGNYTLCICQLRPQYERQTKLSCPAPGVLKNDFDIDKRVETIYTRF